MGNNHGAPVLSCKQIRQVFCLSRCPNRLQGQPMDYSFPPLLQHPGWPAGRGLWNLGQARQEHWARTNLLLTLQRFPVHHPLDSGLGVPIGSTHQPPILTRSQNQVLGFIQPVGSSWKTRRVQAGGVSRQGQAGDTRWEP